MLKLLAPTGPLRGTIQLPPSKSLVNRLLVLDHLRGFHTPDSAADDADDISIMKRALHDIQLHKNSINVQHAGTAMRFLTALLAVSPGQWQIDGSERMRQRPIAPLVDALTQLGADIRYVGKKGYPPLSIEGKYLSRSKCRLDAGISSQFITALLLVAPFLPEGLDIELQGRAVSSAYFNMTLDLLNELGVKTDESDNHIRVWPGITTGQPEPEADWSAASYLFSLCALRPGSTMVLRGLKEDSLQGDAVLKHLFYSLGVEAQFVDGDLFLKNHQNVCTGMECDLSDSPDLAQTLAVCCFGLGIEAQLSGLDTLRHKETDRIQALATELKKLGAELESSDTHLHLYARKSRIKAGMLINTYQDHRMAMSFAPLALLTDSIIFDDHLVVNKSWPGFWQGLLSLGFSVNLQPS